MKKKFSRIMGVGLTLAMLLSLAVGAVPATADVYNLNVVLSNYTISAPTIYTLLFDINLAIPANGTITVTFPTGSNASALAAANDVQLGSTSGIGVPAFPQGNVVYAAPGVPPAAQALVVTVPQNPTAGAPAGSGIGAGAKVQLIIGTTNGVLNPGAITDYTLTAFTSAELTPVASNTYTTITPVVPPLPGKVEYWNEAVVLINNATGAGAIQAMLNLALVAGSTVKIFPGTYTENPNSVAAGVTIIGVDAAGGAGTAATVVINGSWNLTHAVTLDTLSLSGTVTAAANATVQNCLLTNAAGIALTVTGGTAALTPAISSGNTITAGAALAGQTGINVAAGQFATSSGDIITLADAGSTGIVDAGTLTVTGATITGASGIGINTTGTLTTVTGSSLSGLTRAIIIGTGATAIITGNTITACGDATTVGSELPTIDIIALPTSVRIAGNTIADSPHALLRIAVAPAGAAAVTFMNFNTITGAVVGITNLDTTGTVDCTNNYWGAATGPAVVSTATIVTTSPFLRGPISSGTIYPNVATLTNTTVGVLVAEVTAAGAVAWTNAGVALYDANPATAEPPGEATKYLDIYVNPTNPGDTISITILGIQSAAAQVYAWSAAQGLWVLCSAQTVDLFQGGIVVTVTAATSPTLTNLAALEFALVEPALGPMGAIAGPDLVPAIAATGVSVNPTFTWTAIAGADNYDFVIAEEIGQDDPFAIPEYADTAMINAHVSKKTLKYDTQYNWRVRPSRVTGVTEFAPGDVREDIEKGAWVVGLFVTESEPEEAAPPIVIEEAATVPAPILTSPDVIVNIPPEETVEVIPSSLLWIIVAVGAVLVIAVIVLIVRTRRV